MATGLAATQGIYVNNGSVMTMSELYREYINGRLWNYIIHYVDPNRPETVFGTRVDTVINEKARMAVRLTTEDGASVTVSAAGLIVDASEDDVPRMTLKLPSDAKCLVGPNGLGSGKLLVRRIEKREYIVSTIMTLPIPNVIASSNFIVVC